MSHLRADLGGVNLSPHFIHPSLPKRDQIMQCCYCCRAELRFNATIPRSTDFTNLLLVHTGSRQCSPQSLRHFAVGSRSNTHKSAPHNSKTPSKLGELGTSALAECGYRGVTTYGALDAALYIYSRPSKPIAHTKKGSSEKELPIFIYVLFVLDANQLATFFASSSSPYSRTLRYRVERPIPRRRLTSLI